MEIVFTPKASSDLGFWKRSGNISVQKKIKELLLSIADTPLSGIGKPELLRHDLTGRWSRRINQEHRIIYRVEATSVIVYSLKGHYI